MTPDHFAEHLQVLQRFRPLALSEVSPGGYPLKRGLGVAITFDDGYSDNLRTAAPLLRRYDMPATFFIATGYIGGSSEYWWDELERIVFGSAQLPSVFQAKAGAWTFSYVLAAQSRDEIYEGLYEQLRPLSHEVRQKLLAELREHCFDTPPPRPERLPMTLPELQQLARDPLFEIGAHTVSHPLLSARPDHEQAQEIGGSKRYLEERLGRPITSLSFPYGGKGHYKPSSVAAAGECGFARACTTEGGPVRRRDGPLEISRVNVTDMDGDAFGKLLQS